MTDPSADVVRVQADQTRCVGAGQCLLTSPDVFDQDDDGIVTVLESAPPPATWDDVRLAVQLCPSGAIELADEQEVSP